MRRNWSNLRPVPDLSHLWQRFMLASALVFGLFIGVVATVFGYSNVGSVDVRWSIFHIDGIPLWTVAVVPLAIVLVAGTLYHWFNSLHHFTEHMRHRRRVHELEAELATLRGHLDQVLEMPDQSSSRLSAKPIMVEPALAETAAQPVEASPAPALPEPGASNGVPEHTRRPVQRKKVTVEAIAEPAAAEPLRESAPVTEPEVAKEPEPAPEPVAEA
jgi:hypothetical protein